MLQFGICNMPRMEVQGVCLVGLESLAFGGDMFASRWSHAVLFVVGVVFLNVDMRSVCGVVAWVCCGAPRE